MVFLFTLWEIIKSIALQSSQWHHPNCSWYPWRKSRIVCSRIMKQTCLQSSWGSEKKRVAKHTLPGALLFSTLPLSSWEPSEAAPSSSIEQAGSDPARCCKLKKPGCSPQRLQRGLWGCGQPENLATVNLASPVDLEPRFGCFCTDRPGKRGGGCLLIKGRWAVMSVQETGEPPAGRVPRAGLELDLDIPWRPSELPRQGCASTPTAQAPWKVWLRSNLL